MAGSVSGLLFASGGDMPQVSALDDYAPSTITRVYASDGQVVGEFATQRRVVSASGRRELVAGHRIVRQVVRQLELRRDVHELGQRSRFHFPHHSTAVRLYGDLAYAKLATDLLVQEA